MVTSQFLRSLSVRVAALALIATVAMPMSTQAEGRSRHYGPFASDSSDSGTCGITDWANDTFDRVYTVDTRQNSEGAYTVNEEFKNGAFVTIAGSSPGACESGPFPGNGNTVGAGVTGKMHGSFTIIVTGGTFDPAATCSAPCYTVDFVGAVFGPRAKYTVPTFSFHYNARDNGEWKNASADRGGNHGDITGS
ncbi:MAG: hypothetical protein ACR2OO_02730 [Thermomicrobiales bacterium]